MCDEEEIIDWRVEAEAVIHDIKAHVKSVAISNELKSNPTEIYLNLVTLEDEKYCIKLNGEGFKVAGKGFDNQELEAQDVEPFETPYSLLSTISKKFTESFGNTLIKELSKLKK